MDTFQQNPARLVTEAGREVLGHPAYLLLASAIAVLVLAATLWLPNYRLLGAVFTTPGVAFATKLQLLASLAGGLASNFGAVAALAAVIVPVLFGVDVAMIVYFAKQRRAPGAWRDRREPGRRGERRDRGRLRGLRFFYPTACPFLPRGRRSARALAARRRRARLVEHRPAAALDLSHRPQDRRAAGVRIATRTDCTRYAPTAHEEHAMNHDHRPQPGFRWRSPFGMALLGFLAIAGFFLITEHRAHALGALPFVLVALCPLLHRFGHGGHRHSDKGARP